MEPRPVDELLHLAIQAGGAAAVCAMFLWFLTKKQTADDASRDTFLKHIRESDDANREYLRERDSQSRAIAESGHAALREVAAKVSELSTEIRRNGE